MNVQDERKTESAPDTDFRSKLRRVESTRVESTEVGNKKDSAEKKKKPVVKKKKSSKIDNDAAAKVSDSVKLREKCQNEEAETRAEETDRIARHVGEGSVRRDTDTRDENQTDDSPDILRTSGSGDVLKEEEGQKGIETIKESQEDKYRQESHLIGIIEHFYDQVNEAKNKSILLAQSANSAIENAAIVEDIIQSIELSNDGTSSHPLDLSIVDQTDEATRAAQHHSEETQNIAKSLLEAKEKAVLHFQEISASNCKVETPDIIRSSRICQNKAASSETEAGGADSANVVFDYLQDCQHCVEELEIIERQILTLSENALTSSEAARQQREKINEVVTRSHNDLQADTAGHETHDEVDSKEDNVEQIEIKIEDFEDFWVRMMKIYKQENMKIHT